MKDFKKYLKIVQESYDVEHDDDVQAELDIKYLKKNTHKFPNLLERGLNHEKFMELILDEKKVNEIMKYLDNKIKFLEDYKDKRILNALSYLLRDLTQTARMNYMKQQKLTRDQLEYYEEVNQILKSYMDKIDTRLGEVLNSEEEKERQNQETTDLELGWKKQAAKEIRKNQTY